MQSLQWLVGEILMFVNNKLEIRQYDWPGALSGQHDLHIVVEFATRNYAELPSFVLRQPEKCLLFELSVIREL